MPPCLCVRARWGPAGVGGGGGTQGRGTPLSFSSRMWLVCGGGCVCPVLSLIAGLLGANSLLRWLHATSDLVKYMVGEDNVVVVCPLGPRTYVGRPLKQIPRDGTTSRSSVPCCPNKTGRSYPWSLSQTPFLGFYLSTWVLKCRMTIISLCSCGFTCLPQLL